MYNPTTDISDFSQLIDPQTRSVFVMQSTTIARHYDRLIELAKPENHFIIRYWALIHLDTLHSKDIKLIASFLYQQDSRIRELSINLLYRTAEVTPQFLEKWDVTSQILNTLLDKNPKVCRVTILILPFIPDKGRAFDSLYALLINPTPDDNKLYWLLKGIYHLGTENLATKITLILDFIRSFITHKNYVIREQLAYLLRSLFFKNKILAEDLILTLSQDQNFYVRTIAQELQSYILKTST